MTDSRLDENAVEQKLSELPALQKALGLGWVSEEFKKPVKRWSLITGWLSTPDSDSMYPVFAGHLKDLDSALALLEPRVVPTCGKRSEEDLRALRSCRDQGDPVRDLHSALLGSSPSTDRSGNEAARRK